MSRVVRKESPNIQSWIGVNKTKTLFFINLDRCLSVEMLSSNYQAMGLKQLFKLDRWLAVELAVEI